MDNEKIFRRRDCTRKPEVWKVICDVVVIDITMPDLNGMDATRRILAADPRIRVVALSVHSDKRFVANMFAAGARGYLRKDCAGEELIQAIRTVLHGDIYRSPGVAAATLPDDPGVEAEVATVDAPLSTKEREVTQLIAAYWARNFKGFERLGPHDSKHAYKSSSC